MELTKLERHLLDDAEQKASKLLRLVKQKPRQGRELKFLKQLEEVVQTFEALRCI